MNERSIFLAALEIQDPAARLAYLETASLGMPSCGGRSKPCSSHTSKPGHSWRFPWWNRWPQLRPR